MLEPGHAQACANPYPHLERHCYSVRPQPEFFPREAEVFAPPQVDPRRWRGPCQARCRYTGKRCDLPAHPVDQPHRHGRTEFTAVATPDQVSFEKRDELDAAAQGRPEGIVPEAGERGSSSRRLVTNRAANQRYREKQKLRGEGVPTNGAEARELARLSEEAGDGL